MSPSAPAPTPPPSGRAAALRRWGLYALALALLVAAVYAVRGSITADLGAAVARLSVADALVLGLFPLGNWLLTGLMFHVLTRHFGQVGRGEMMALIGASWLLNYLPLQPGLIGRVAYHRAVNGIPVRSSLMVILAAFGCTFGAAGMMVGAVLAAGAFAAQVVTMLSVPPVLLGGAAVVCWILAPRGAAWRLLTAGLLRFLDMSLAAARYSVVFAALGATLPEGGAAKVAAAAQVAMLPPLPFGLREWTVHAVGSGLLGTGAPGLTADLANRALELAVALPVGLVSSAWLYRRQRRAAVIGTVTAQPDSSGGPPLPR
ncbi:MAG: hypothetical protein ACT4PL_15025 [Phycisphaerales bacterium]